MCASSGRGSWLRSSLSFALAFVTLCSIESSVVTAHATAASILPGYTVRAWTRLDGLPQNPIRTVVQTSDGYLWLGTANAGLVRFDGASFSVFDVANTPELPSNWISWLLEDRDGTLWIGTDRGLSRYRAGRFAAGPSEIDGTKPFVTGIRLDGLGRLWVSSLDRLVRREGERWVSVPVGTDSIHRFFVERDGRTVWVASPDGLIQWHDGSVRRWTEQDGLPHRSVTAFMEDRSGDLWLGTERGVVRFDRQRRAIRRELPELSDRVDALLTDADGVRWIGSGRRLLSWRPDGSISSADLGPTGTMTVVSDITADREGHLWMAVGGGAGGLYRIRRQTVGVLDGFGCDNIGPTTAGYDGTIWLGTYCRTPSAVIAIRDGQRRSFEGPGIVSSLLVDPDGTLWAGTHGGSGLFRLVGDRFVSEPVPLDGPDVAVLALHRDRRGVLWLGTSRGLFRQQQGRWTGFHRDDGLPGEDVRTLAEGADGTIWIGTVDGLANYQNGRFTTYTTAQGLPRGPVRAIHVDGDGTVWIGTYGGGLGRLKNGRVTAYGTQDGVLDSSVHRILPDDRGFLWLSGDRGIRRVSRRELDDVAEGRAARVAAMLFDEADGMKSAECNGMGQPAGDRLRDGTLWLPTQHGVVRIDPSQAEHRVTTDPRPVIESVLLAAAPGTAPPSRQPSAGTSGQPASLPAAPIPPPREPLVAAAGTSEIEVRYTAPTFSRPRQVQFRYRLDGYDATWVEAGNRRVAHYANLRPGSYTFRVAARSPDGQWSEQSATVGFVLPPRWYQRRWIYALGAVLLLAGLVGATRWRVASYRRRARDLEATVRERTREVERQRDEVRAAHARLEATTAQVAQSHAQVVAVLDQLEVAALVLDRDGTIRYATEPARHLLEDEATPLQGCAWTACLPLSEAERAQVLACFDAPPASRTRLPVQVSIRGRRYWMAIDVRDDPSPGPGRILYLNDITEVFGLRNRYRGGDTFPEIVGGSSGIQLVFKQIRDVATTDMTVLIEGETGSGKELVARAIHQASRRAGKPFLAVNTAGLADSLIASQLFGHRRGSFTGAVADQVGLFEAAQGGTLFLDEIGDIPASIQPSLLRVLQEREITRVGETASRKIDVRFVAATHRDLTREAAEGRFRQDLLYRLRVVTIKVPPLRDRVDDVPVLVEKFLAEAAAAAAKDVGGISREAMDRLLLYSWPGNVRELKSAIEQAVLRAQGPVLRPEAFPIEIARGVPLVAASTDAAERERLAEALRRAGGNRSEAARLLGIGRATLYRKLAAHGLVDR